MKRILIILFAFVAVSLQAQQVKTIAGKPHVVRTCNNVVFIDPVSGKGATKVYPIDGKVVYYTGDASYADVVVSGAVGLKSRGNTIGSIEVTPESYDTNNGETTITVGASGADYTSLTAATDAASAGDVIEILDDAVTLTDDILINIGIDGNGKGLKIKGKSTKTTVNMYSTTYPFTIRDEASCVECENLIFVDPNANFPIYNFATNVGGFIHFINCEFRLKGNMYLLNSKETVFDGCTFTSALTANQHLNVINNANLDTEAKIIINNCEFTNTNSGHVLRLTNGNNVRLKELHITNSTFELTGKVVERVDSDQVAYSYVSAKGNTLHGTQIGLGAEASVLVIDGFDAYNSATSYTTGDYCYIYGVLWECVSDCLDSEPSRTNTNWKEAEICTGEIENNLIYSTTQSGYHGIFVGFGCYDFSIKNNIVTNYTFNYVIKGHNNTIQYNASGKGYNGFSIFANDQALVANNTSRSEDYVCIEYGPQGAGGIGPTNTIFRDNIFLNPVNGDNIFTDLYARWTSYPGDTHTFNQNVWYGDSPYATFKGTTYSLGNSTERENFFSSLGDDNALFINPSFNESNDTLETYYLPTSSEICKLKDANSQAVGAVDITKY